ncbi:MAG: response regulator [Dehalococcoidia bacterium]
MVRNSGSSRIRVLVVDDNELFREGLISLLTKYQTVNIVGQARDGSEAIQKTRLLRPDVILMDVSMPRLDGVTAAQRIKAEHPNVNIAMLTVSEDETDLFSAVRSGARGYLVKSVGVEDIETAIQTVAAGGTIVTPHLAHKLLDEFAKLTQGPKPGPRETENLTAREREVLELVAKGASNKEIAQRLVIAENTVKVHLRNILDKLHLRNRQQAAALAVQEGLVDNVREQVPEDDGH